ncbi:hypothetical protein WH87_02310 [Devosia epidermidihirudinis]|uniref:Thioredoxin domain-containing protein n=1 Tax=Devosia epidermidihirudinis TaxID=1293439 RepID=A0A0F5QJT4_9HYPH|nr:TlpA disulfide reductase family protein [Devosia epidermidihirudinis]KKC41001.1 hypothetical protein WH87_02310 [Devosia epidermidihirudinis]
MNAVSIGPMLFSSERFAAIIGIALFWLAMMIAGRFTKRPLSDLAFAMIAVGVIAARLAHIALHFESFAADPLRVFAVWQGGFNIWGGLFGAALVMALRVRDRRKLMGIAAACMVGLAGWGAAIASTQPASTPPLPGENLMRLEGGVTSLATLGGGPMVINLWATWCPPCVREMPMMSEAAAANPDITFAFVNQGDDPTHIRAFLDEQSLSLPNILLDPSWQTLHHYGAMGLPTTLFVAADGAVSYSFSGEVSPELLETQMRALRAQ